MSSESMTSNRHNDFVGGDASKGRIPGAEDATSGHHFVSVDYMDGMSLRLSSTPNSDRVALHTRPAKARGGTPSRGAPSSDYRP